MRYQWQTTDGDWSSTSILVDTVTGEQLHTYAHPPQNVPQDGDTIAAALGNILGADNTLDPPAGQPGRTYYNTAGQWVQPVTAGPIVDGSTAWVDAVLMQWRGGAWVPAPNVNMSPAGAMSGGLGSVTYGMAADSSVWLWVIAAAIAFFMFTGEGTGSRKPARRSRKR